MLRGAAIFCLTCALWAQVADSQLELTGTIGENSALPGFSGGDPGYSFQLNEHPRINFLFHTPSIEHQGRYLREGIEGMGVRVQCKKPKAGDLPDTCEVQSLTWLTPSPNMTEITGTVAQFTPLARVTLNERGAGEPGQVTARFRGVRFQLREHPDRDYEFQAPEFVHEGRSLIENLVGARVNLTVFCLPQDAAEPRRYCDVGSLRWMPAQFIPR